MQHEKLWTKKCGQLNENAKMLATKLHQLQLIKPKPRQSPSPRPRLRLRPRPTECSECTASTANNKFSAEAGQGERPKRHKSLANNNFELTLTLAKRGRQQADGRNRT